MKSNFSNLKDIRGRQGAIAKTMSDLWTQAGDPSNPDFSKVTVFGDLDTKGKVEKITALSNELKDLHDDALEFEAIIKSRHDADLQAKAGNSFHPAEEPGEIKDQKAFGLQIKEAAKNRLFIKNGRPVDFDVDLKSIVQTGAGWAPESMRLPRTELYPLRTLRVADMFPTYTTGMSDVKYMEETTHTNNAAEIAEETNAAAPTAYGEAALVMTERTVPIEKIPVWIPVTEEQMEDVEGIGEFLTNRLTYMVRNRLDGQLVAGDGNTPNLRGVNNATNVQSQAKGTDPTLDAVFKAHTKVRGVAAGTGFGEPSANIVHPNDWQAIRLVRTADGIYILGNPTELGAVPLWGVPTVVTSAATENTLTTGDFTNFAALYVKRGISVEYSNSHGSLFTAGVLAVKATMRCAAVYFRGSAFCKVTGI